MAAQLRVHCLVGLASCTVSQETSWSDTDAFAPDRVGVASRTTHIATDLLGTWEARVPKTLARKLEIIDGRLEGRAAEDFEPPLSRAERVWFDRAADPDAPYIAWHRCATRCRFDLRDSAIWNHGYFPYGQVGSGLATVTIEGRDVHYVLTDHDPMGMSGTVHLRMNKDWTAFRVVSFDLLGYRDRHLGQKLEIFYERRDER